MLHFIFDSSRNQHRIVHTAYQVKASEPTILIVNDTYFKHTILNYLLCMHPTTKKKKKHHKTQSFSLRTYDYFFPSSESDTCFLATAVGCTFQVHITAHLCSILTNPSFSCIYSCQIKFIRTRSILFYCKYVHMYIQYKVYIQVHEWQGDEEETRTRNQVLRHVSNTMATNQHPN